MADILRFPGKGNVGAGGDQSIRYTELADCSDGDAAEGFRVVVAKRDDDPDNLHLVLVGGDCVELLGSYSHSVLSVEACQAVGELASRAISMFFMSLPDEETAQPRGAKLSEASSPESRATILAETLKCASQIIGDFTEPALFSQVREAIGLPEERCSAEIMGLIGLLIREGLIECNTFDAATGAVWFRAATQLRVSAAITRFVWRDEVYDGPEDGGAA